MKGFIRFTLAAVAAITLATPAIALAQAAKPVIAVLYFDNNSFGRDRADYEGLGKGIADMLITDMAGNPSVRVVEREQIQSLLTEQQLTKTGTIDPNTAIKLGKIIGAQYMITGGFMSDGHGTLTLTARAINVETSAIVNPVKLTSKGDDVLGLINQLSTQLNTSMKLPALQVGQTGMAPTPAGTPAGTPTDASASQTATTQVAVTQTAQADTAKAVTTATTTTTASTTPVQTTASTTTVRPTTTTARPQQKMDLRTAMLYSRALEEQDAGNNTRARELYSQVLAIFPTYTPARTKLDKLSHS